MECSSSQLPIYLMVNTDVHCQTLVYSIFIMTWINRINFSINMFQCHVSFHTKNSPVYKKVNKNTLNKIVQANFCITMTSLRVLSSVSLIWGTFDMACYKEVNIRRFVPPKWNGSLFKYWGWSLAKRSGYGRCTPCTHVMSTCLSGSPLQSWVWSRPTAVTNPRCLS